MHLKTQQLAVAVVCPVTCPSTGVRLISDSKMGAWWCVVQPQGESCCSGAASGLDHVWSALCELQVLVGGKLPAAGSGQFYPPTVVMDVTPDMRIWQEEVFGPVLAGELLSKCGYVHQRSPCATTGPGAWFAA